MHSVRRIKGTIWIIGSLGVVLLGGVMASCNGQGGLGMFEGQTNVGDASLGGDVAYEAGADVYRVTGSGEDIYGDSDAFYYVWRKAEGDVVLSADVAFEGSGRHQYR